MADSPHRPPPPPRRPPPSQADNEIPGAEPGGALSQNQKDALAFQALGLLNEQLQARIVHYKGELETSPELDAVTAQVVAQLKAMQAAVASEEVSQQSPEEKENLQIRTFGNLLHRVFDEQSTFFASSLKPIGRRVAKLFFESELHDKTKGDKERTIHHPEQGLYYVLQRYKNRMTTELEMFEYSGPEVRQATLDLLEKTERDLQVAFLSRRSPELRAVMAVFSTVLSDFLTQHMPPRVDAIAKVTIRSARSARRPNSVAYKVHPEVFNDFRANWERVFIQQMVNYCGDSLLARLDGADTKFLDETVKFFTDPQIFSAAGGVLCDSLYDFLCLEGFLDLPVDWRIQHSRD